MALAQSRIYEIENQLDRLQATVEAYSQDLVAWTLAREYRFGSSGEFVTELMVRAPPDITQSESEPMDSLQSFSFEVHSLDVELGQHVEAGKVLMHLADHRSLFIEGRGFKDDMPLVQMAASSNIGVEIDVDEPDLATWPAFQEKLFIDHISNTIDSASRTFAFFCDWKISGLPTNIWGNSPALAISSGKPPAIANRHRENGKCIRSPTPGSGARRPSSICVPTRSRRISAMRSAFSTRIGSLWCLPTTARFMLVTASFSQVPQPLIASLDRSKIPHCHQMFTFIPMARFTIPVRTLR